MKYLLISILLFFSSQSVLADYLKVTSKSIVRQDSLSSSPELVRVPAGSLLPILDPNRLYGTGWWKVSTASGTGYIYKTRGRKVNGELPVSFGTSSSSPVPTESYLEVNVINVGQADAILIRCPDGDHELLIDAGDLNYHRRYPGSLTEFKQYMRAFQDKDNKIEVVVATHPHSDHIAGMQWMLTNYQVGSYVDNGRPNDNSNTYKKLETYIKTHSVNRKSLTDSSVPEIDFCPRSDVNAIILRPEGYDDLGSDENNYSVVVRVDYGQRSFLFTGDAEKEMEHRLLEDPVTSAQLDVDFLKVGHHGSYSSSFPDFLDVVTPDIAAISCGAETIGTNEGHRHPRMVTVNNLLPYLENRTMATTIEAFNTPKDRWEQVETKKALYVTNNDGDLIFLCDGKEIWHKMDR